MLKLLIMTRSQKSVILDRPTAVKLFDILDVEVFYRGENKKAHRMDGLFKIQTL
jgi:hypothetical protein